MEVDAHRAAGAIYCFLDLPGLRSQVFMDCCHRPDTIIIFYSSWYFLSVDFFFLIHLNFRADCVRTFFYLTEQKEDPGKNDLHRVQVSDLGSSLSLASLLSSPRAPVTPGKLCCHRLEMKRIPVDLEKWGEWKSIQCGNMQLGKEAWKKNDGIFHRD